MQFSKFGNRFTRHTGARQLMDDLGAALATEDHVMMLGGGNPAHIPEILELLAQRTREVAANPREFRRMVADYSSPAGEDRFRAALAGLLRREYGWDLGAENIALTGGSQTGFFQLFNLLAGEFDDGSQRRVMLPLTPEYVGYADLGLTERLFVSTKPRIEYLDNHLFKYHIDFDRLILDDNIAAICVSRPTNPTGNVLTDDEVRKLAAMARASDIPLIIDNAYGVPFPRIIFRKIEAFWDSNIILCMSLSKIGLPATRTGIVVAREEIIDALTSLNAIMSLAVSSVAPVLLRDWVESGEIIKLSRTVIQPFYQQRVEQALEWMHEALAGCEYYIHRPEGALFLWLWMPELKITSADLYQRLKDRGVYVLPGHHFFPGLDVTWPHRDQCIRVTYSQDSDSVRQGIRIIGEEARKASG
ncbi:MAG: valine--pyruvate transaminase [Gammaproteobacteria bacterium]|nr:valine--pyruvate transaminase [Gammaproteobacteria bacterium]